MATERIAPPGAQELHSASMRTSLVTVLLATDVVFNFAFYLVMPMLARHLVENLALAAWVGGVILGIRNLSHQGLFPVGGLLAERFGARTVMVAGCLLRAAAFSGFGFATGFAALTCFAAAAGFAGALFTPAMKALLAETHESERTQLFARSETLQQVGALAGPAAGIGLTQFGFETIATVGAVVFLIWGIVLLWFLGSDGTRAADRDATLERMKWYEYLGFHPRLFRFSLLTIVYVAMFNQLYFCLPLSLAQAMPQWSSGTLFMAFGGAILLAYRPLRRVFEDGGSADLRLALGYAVMGVGWLPLLLPWPSPLMGGIHLLVAAVQGIGSLIAYPAIMALIPRIVDEQRLAVAFGLFYTVAWGLGGVLVNIVSGWLFEESSTVLWAVLVASAIAHSAYFYAKQPHAS
ncbi:MAG: MFS transporter [Myxococcota bacterium]